MQRFVAWSACEASRFLKRSFYPVRRSTQCGLACLWLTVRTCELSLIHRCLRFFFIVAHLLQLEHPGFAASAIEKGSKTREEGPVRRLVERSPSCWPLRKA